jgi:hypothetical protein
MTPQVWAVLAALAHRQRERDLWLLSLPVSWVIHKPQLRLYTNAGWELAEMSWKPNDGY